MAIPAIFVRQVRHALTHLYDPDALRSSPLISMLGLTSHENARAALRDTLIAAIEELKPTPSVPVASRGWRIYRLLHCRYVQQMDQEQTADQIGLSVRHLRREQRVAVQTLAEMLNKKHGCATVEARVERRGTTELEDELSWLKTAASGQVAEVAEAFRAMLRLVSTLAESRRTRLEMPSLPSSPAVAVHPAALRQALISATTYVIRRTPRGWVRFSLEERRTDVALTITGIAQQSLEASSDDTAASLDAARAILGMHQGSLSETEKTRVLSLTLALPLADSVDVLLVDDNADAAQLFQRYVYGTRYRLHATSQPGQVLDLLTTHPIKIVILDVMIPGTDGWEILWRLRERSSTSNLPVIVCTVLPERDLAMTLGAVAFLRKPVTREALLSSLEQALGAEVRGSR
jgi:CheY-like chemotaxis protein